ncbi:MAG: prefoldin subunit beta [Methanosarcinales archaeon]|nr:prefoldin subunit beta [Methanosarcinales archaeon]HDJ38562.1 prefoldin subunit beta [Methanosarcinales archaeon]
MTTEIPAQVQHQLAQLQQVQQQAQALATQKAQVTSSLNEIEMALGELEKLDSDAVIYKNVGQLLIKGERDSIEVELKEKKETMELRAKTLERQEERIRKRFQQLQEQLQSAIGGAGDSEVA